MNEKSNKEPKQEKKTNRGSLPVMTGKVRVVPTKGAVRLNKKKKFNFLLFYLFI